MEVCNKIPVSACTDSDWYVNLSPLKRADTTITQAEYTAGAGTTATAPAPELQRFPRRVAFKRNPPSPQTTPPTYPLDSPATPVPLGINSSGAVVSGPDRLATNNNGLWFATTATSGASAVTYGSESFPFVFNQARKDGSGAELPQLDTASAPATPPPPAVPTTVAKGSQPLLMPVLQTQTLTAAPPAASSVSLPRGAGIVKNTGWMPRAVETTFNMVAASNDTPSRAMGNGFGDFNGGLQNLPRFVENWYDGTKEIPANIQGSFIQFNRSAYSTAPYQPILNPNTLQHQNQQTKLRSLFDAPPSNSLTTTALIPSLPAPVTVNYNGGAAPDFLYRTDNSSVPPAVVPGGGGRTPFFSPPTRNWGFDVGLLSQPADLFTQKFTTPPSTPTPNEYFREVPRDDDWVKTLMCGVVAPNQPNVDKKATEYGCPT